MRRFELPTSSTPCMLSLSNELGIGLINAYNCTCRPLGVNKEVNKRLKVVKSVFHP
jgi:hypothetical protein